MTHNTHTLRTLSKPCASRTSTVKQMRQSIDCLFSQPYFKDTYYILHSQKQSMLEGWGECSITLSQPLGSITNINRTVYRLKNRLEKNMQAMCHIPESHREIFIITGAWHTNQENKPAKGVDINEVLDEKRLNMKVQQNVSQLATGSFTRYVQF